MLFPLFNQSVLGEERLQFQTDLFVELLFGELLAYLLHVGLHLLLVVRLIKDCLLDGGKGLSLGVLLVELGDDDGQALFVFGWSILFVPVDAYELFDFL